MVAAELRERLGFVGEYREFDVAALQFFQNVFNAGIRCGFMMPGIRIVPLIIQHPGVDVFRGQDIRGERSFDQSPHSIADVTRENFHGLTWITVIHQHQVDGFRQVCKGVNQSAVEVKNKYFHGHGMIEEAQTRPIAKRKGGLCCKQRRILPNDCSNFCDN